VANSSLSYWFKAMPRVLLAFFSGAEFFMMRNFSCHHREKEKKPLSSLVLV
jgi:hypothetical protein